MEFIKESNRVYIEENKELLAEITFPLEEEGIVNINHTFVSDKLRGMGIASQLVLKAYEVIKESDLKAKVSCSYAINWFSKHTEYNDIL